MHKNLAFAAIVLAGLVADARAVTLSWSPVGNAANAADTLPDSPYGAVDHAYSISTYDVTNSQYVAFLNATDPTGANALGLWYSPASGINRALGNPNGLKYTVPHTVQNHPVNYVTWYDALRFANWMNNGQGSSSTETGAYTLLGGTPTPSNFDTITRNPGALIFLPSEDEWYKAAYYNAGGSSYFQFPTSTNATPIASAPTALANHANYNSAVGSLTDVGAYSGTTSPYGAFDMGGNVFQWTDTLFLGYDPEFGRTSTYAVRRGGSFEFTSVGNFLESDLRAASLPYASDYNNGFRLAMVPEPRSLVLAAFALTGFAAWGWRRKR